MKWFYLRDEKRNPVACVASDKYTSFKGSDHEHENVAFAVSTYNPKDQFSKSIARSVAVGRVGAGLSFGWGQQGAFTMRLVPSVKKEIVSFIARGNFPARTKNAAKLWLTSLEDGSYELRKAMRKSK